MLDGVGHWRPLVNGDSGFIPRPYARLLELLGGPLDEDGLRLLRAVGVTHVVSAMPLSIPEAARFGGEGVYALEAGEAARAVPLGEPVATSWSRDGALMDLGVSRLVSGIVFEASDADWAEHPQVLASADGRSWEVVEDARAALSDATLSLLQDPRHGRGEIGFAPRRARFLRVPPSVPARRGLLEVVP